MTVNLPSLDVIDVASPCDFSWEKMQGSDTVRHCPQCKKNVYNLSGLSREEALKTIEEHDGKLCVRFFRRHDGTILTQDCPVGIRAVRRRLARMVASMAAMVAFLTWGTLFARGSQTSGGGKRFADGPLTRLGRWIEPEQMQPSAGPFGVPPFNGQMMGLLICAPPSQGAQLSPDAVPLEPLEGPASDLENSTLVQ